MALPPTKEGTSEPHNDELDIDAYETDESDEQVEVEKESRRCDEGEDNDNDDHEDDLSLSGTATLYLNLLFQYLETKARNSMFHYSINQQTIITWEYVSGMWKRIATVSSKPVVPTLVEQQLKAVFRKNRQQSRKISKHLTLMNCYSR